MSGTRAAFTGTTAIVGIGATEFSKESGRSELRLAVEAVDLALRDAGIEPDEVDGLVTFSSDTNPEIEIARSLGIGRADLLQPDPLRRRGRVRHHPTGGDGGGVRRGRRGGLLSGVQRAVGQQVRGRRPEPAADPQRRDRQLRLVRARSAC